MATTHIIIGGVVANTIQATPEEAQAAYPDAICIPADTGAIGWLWDGQTLTPPPAPTPSVPASVTMRQARLALLGAGLLDDVDAAINGLPSPQKEAARIEWDYSNEVQRHNSFTSMLGAGLGLSAAQIDQLFIQAATL